MKRLNSILGLLAAAGALTMLGAAEDDKSPEQPELQVRVVLPASVDPIHEDDVIDIFAQSVRDAFRRKGYRGQLEELRFGQDPDLEAPLLTIYVTTWRRNRTGGIDCIFTAAVRPMDGEERRLGVFHATEMGMNISGPWQLGDAFRDAAEQAAADLWRRLARMNILPGIAEPTE